MLDFQAGQATTVPQNVESSLAPDDDAFFGVLPSGASPKDATIPEGYEPEDNFVDEEPEAEETVAVSTPVGAASPSTTTSLHSTDVQGIDQHLAGLLTQLLQEKQNMSDRIYKLSSEGTVQAQELQRIKNELEVAQQRERAAQKELQHTQETNAVPGDPMYSNYKKGLMDASGQVSQAIQNMQQQVPLLQAQLDMAVVEKERLSKAVADLTVECDEILTAPLPKADLVTSYNLSLLKQQVNRYRITLVEFQSQFEWYKGFAAAELQRTKAALQAYQQQAKHNPLLPW
ncbi:hypothetical protein O6H91_16G046100 [Diphasiastrum complanatum]|uniref:Uncharacterized protein n=1 Tax=Diphasiastrum complanatum TaxID=34168 RepID=A0ACC2BBZ0_DIPCM|nr:hypothetical protein O6H91_16G046100 [Diphasiastrum complanatum]